MTGQPNSVEANMWYFRVGNARPSGKNRPLDGDHELIEVDSACEPKWFHRASHAMTFGVRVDSRHVMTRFRWRAGSVFDVIRWNCYWVVSERFRAIVDRLEPGLHQFLPVDFIGTRGVTIARMFVFVPNVALRCFSKLSIGFHPIGWETRWGDHVWHVEGSCRNCRLIFEDGRTKGHHLWVATDIWNTPILVSNELRKEFETAGLTNVHFCPAESRERLRWMLPEILRSPLRVDPPWVEWLSREAV